MGTIRAYESPSRLKYTKMLDEPMPDLKAIEELVDQHTVNDALDITLDSTFLQFALISEHLHLKVIELLINKGADVNFIDNSNNSILFYAIRSALTSTSSDRPEAINIVLLLIDKGAILEPTADTKTLPWTTIPSLKDLIDNLTKLKTCPADNKSNIEKAISRNYQELGNREAAKKYHFHSLLHGPINGCYTLLETPDYFLFLNYLTEVMQSDGINFAPQTLNQFNAWNYRRILTIPDNFLLFEKSFINWYEKYFEQLAHFFEKGSEPAYKVLEEYANNKCEFISAQAAQYFDPIKKRSRTIKPNLEIQALLKSIKKPHDKADVDYKIVVNNCEKLIEGDDFKNNKKYNEFSQINIRLIYVQALAKLIECGETGLCYVFTTQIKKIRLAFQEFGHQSTIYYADIARLLTAKIPSDNKLQLLAVFNAGSFDPTLLLHVIPFLTDAEKDVRIKLMTMLAKKYHSMQTLEATKKAKEQYEFILRECPENSDAQMGLRLLRSNSGKPKLFTPIERDVPASVAGPAAPSLTVRVAETKENTEMTASRSIEVKGPESRLLESAAAAPHPVAEDKAPLLSLDNLLITALAAALRTIPTPDALQNVLSLLKKGALLDPAKESKNFKKLDWKTNPTLKELVEDLAKLKNCRFDAKKLNALEQNISRLYEKLGDKEAAKEYYYRALSHSTIEECDKLRNTADYYPFINYLNLVIGLDGEEFVPQTEEQFSAWCLRERLTAANHYQSHLSDKSLKRCDEVYLTNIANFSKKGSKPAREAYKFHTKNSKESLFNRVRIQFFAEEDPISFPWSVGNQTIWKRLLRYMKMNAPVGIVSRCYRMMEEPDFNAFDPHTRESIRLTYIHALTELIVQGRDEKNENMFVDEITSQIQLSYFLQYMDIMELALFYADATRLIIKVKDASKKEKIFNAVFRKQDSFDLLLLTRMLDVLSSEYIGVRILIRSLLALKYSESEDVSQIKDAIKQYKEIIRETQEKPKQTETDVYKIASAGKLIVDLQRRLGLKAIAKPAGVVEDLKEYPAASAPLAPAELPSVAEPAIPPIRVSPAPTYTPYPDSPPPPSPLKAPEGSIESAMVEASLSPPSTTSQLTVQTVTPHSAIDALGEKKVESPVIHSTANMLSALPIVIASPAAVEIAPVAGNPHHETFPEVKATLFRVNKRRAGLEEIIRLENTIVQSKYALADIHSERHDFGKAYDILEQIFQETCRRDDFIKVHALPLNNRLNAIYQVTKADYVWELLEKINETILNFSQATERMRLIVGR